MDKTLQKKVLEQSYFIVGGAGFIGSHLVDYFLSHSQVKKVTLFDNFSSGRRWHFEKHLSDKRFQALEGDVKDLPLLIESMKNHDTVIHLASNPDIAKAIKEPDIDFREGTFLTQNVVEALRICQIPHILYTSGSGVYGDLQLKEAFEDYGPLIPISTYGASKLAGEALISSYCALFGIKACVFRFANVVGPRQTHGVSYDFIKRLLKNPHELSILGDGLQSKSYIHIQDVIQAMMTAHSHYPTNFQCFNVSTLDHSNVNEIASLVMECLNLDKNKVTLTYTGGDRGWKGDVPIVRINSQRIRKLGWENKMTSKEALRNSIVSLIEDIKKEKI